MDKEDVKPKNIVNFAISNSIIENMAAEVCCKECDDGRGAVPYEPQVGKSECFVVFCNKCSAIIFECKNEFLNDKCFDHDDVSDVHSFIINGLGYEGYLSYAALSSFTPVRCNKLYRIFFLF